MHPFLLLYQILREIFMISGMILSIDDYIFKKKTFAIDYNQDLPGPSSIPRKEI
jgi:hypothetical protein